MRMASIGTTQERIEEMKPRLRRMTPESTTNRRATMGMMIAAMLCRIVVFTPTSISSLCGISRARSHHRRAYCAEGRGSRIKMRQSNATRRGGNPSATSIGAASAVGVPKPEAPSMRKTNAYSTTMSRCHGVVGDLPKPCLQYVEGPDFAARKRKLRRRRWKLA